MLSDVCLPLGKGGGEDNFVIPTLKRRTASVHFFRQPLPQVTPPPPHFLFLSTLTPPLSALLTLSHPSLVVKNMWMQAWTWCGGPFHSSCRLDCILVECVQQGGEMIRWTWWMLFTPPPHPRPFSAPPFFLFFVLKILFSSLCFVSFETAGLRYKGS